MSQVCYLLWAPRSCLSRASPLDLARGFGAFSHAPQRTNQKPVSILRSVPLLCSCPETCPVLSGSEGELCNSFITLFDIKTDEFTLSDIQHFKHTLLLVYGLLLH